MSHYLFIVNPHAGRGIGRRVGGEIFSKLARDNLHYDLVYTTEPGQARKIASETEADIVVAVGGDGTVNEVVNGIGSSRKRLAIIPAGSGNDVIKSLRIPRRLDDALDVIRKPHLRTVDTAIIECSLGDQGRGQKHSRLFLNGAGIGFDASVARRVASIRRLRGVPLYLMAVVQTLGNYNSPDVEIQVDGREEVRGDRLLVAIGNGVCAGGGFYLTPRAAMDDGLLDVCAIPALNIAGILRIIPRVLRGTHVSMEGIHYLQAKMITVRSSAGFAVHADGEVLTEDSHEVGIRVLPRSLGVLVPSINAGDRVDIHQN